MLEKIQIPIKFIFFVYFIRLFQLLVNMDLFIDIDNHSNYLNRFLLPKYTYNDLYIRSLNMAYRLKEQNSKYILCFFA